MSIVVVGSIAFDSIKTPSGYRELALGGAANYFALAAHFFGRVRMLGVVGEDYPEAHLELLRKKTIDISGIQRLPGRSFHWRGEYGLDLNAAKTIDTELNVFEHFLPTVPESYQDDATIFLANIDPTLQLHVLRQMKAPRLKALDSMNFWIERKCKELKEVISMIDILFINEAEIRALTGEHNMLKAISGAHKIGARIVVIKRGEYGAVLSADNTMSFVPAFPLEVVFDPTGAGDTFAGGFLGYLDQQSSITLSNLKRAMLLGTIMSSFVIESFSFDRLLEVKYHDIEERVKILSKMANISPANQ